MMTMNEATITKAFQHTMTTMVEYLCEHHEGLAKVVEEKFSNTGASMLRMMILTSEDFNATEAVSLAHFLDKETEAAEVVVKMIREEISKNS